MEKIRLNKYLAQCGVCSRREADELIGRGAVTVDGQIGVVGQAVYGNEVICVRGKRLDGPDVRKVLAFYKPIGVVCTERDPHAEKTINDMISYPVRVTYAGRLDKGSEGLLLLSNDGSLIDAVTRGANRHEKEYIVRVNKEITPDFIQKMTSGIYLEELDVTTRECDVRQTGKYTFELILTQGLNRQIRRMCRACGYHVRSLKRVRVMNIQLGRLKPGEYREITGRELEQLYREAGL